MFNTPLTFCVITKSITRTFHVITRRRAKPVIPWNVTRRSMNYRYQRKTMKESSQSTIGGKRRKNVFFHGKLV